MSKTKHEATLTVIHCDFPRCAEEYDSYSSEEAFRIPESPQGWEHVPWDDGKRLHLCPDHAQHAPVVRLVDAMLDMLKAPLEERATS
jgi:hypothetical protein